MRYTMTEANETGAYGGGETVEEATMEEEETISAYFVLFSALLAVVLVFSRLLHDRPRIAAIVPEAGMILTTGLFFGAIINLFVGGSSSTSDTQISTQSTEGEEDSSVAVSLLSFSPEVFFLVLLPPIIFNSGYHLRKEMFFRHFTPICLFAVVGTTISALVTAGILQVVCQSLNVGGDSFEPTFTELLTFGALLSATDPVSTLAVFQVKRVDPQLFYLVFGESVLNDAVGLVLFNAFSDFVVKDNGAGKVAVDISEFVLGFLYDSVGSPALGLSFGLVTAWLFKRIDMRTTRLLELALFILIMYVPFLLAELLALSGIVTILFSGLAAKAYVVPNLSQTTVEHADVLFRLASHLAETAIFLELGLSVFGLSGSIHVVFIFWTVVACLVARAANVYPITCLFNRHLLQSKREWEEHNDEFVATTTHGSASSNRIASHKKPASQRTPVVELTNLPPQNDDDYESDKENQEDAPHTNDKPASATQPDNDTSDGLFTNNPSQAEHDDLKISPNTAHMLWFSGLRGAVAYACVRSFPNTFGHADEFTMTTMMVVLVSVFGLGSTTECMLKALSIRMHVDESEYIERWSAEGRSPNSWLVRWEELMHRLVVRGAVGSGEHSHMGVPAVDSAGSHSEELGLETVVSGSLPSSSPVRGQDSERVGDLQRSPSSEFRPHTDHEQSSQRTNGHAARLGDSAGSDVEIDHPRRPFQRKESVFDYGAS